MGKIFFFLFLIINIDGQSNEKIEINADQFTYDKENTRIYATGNVEIIDNTETEILNATKEILKIKKFKVSKKLRKKYKLSIKKIGAFYTNAKLSNYFLSKNKKIIRK